MRVCLSAEGAKNVSWPWLSLLSGWGSLTMAFIGKVVYISVKAMRKPIYIIFTSRYSFIRPIYGQCFYYITLRTTEKTLLVFEGSQRMLGGSSWQKWVSHWQDLWDIEIFLVEIVGQCKQTQLFRFVWIWLHKIYHVSSSCVHVSFTVCF